MKPHSPMNDGQKIEISELELEAALRRTLRREEAPAGFAERVLAEAALREKTTVVTLPQRNRVIRMPGLRFAAAAALLLATTLGIRYHSEQQERVQGEAARDQVMLALRITSNKLHRVQMRVSASQSDDASTN